MLIPRTKQCCLLWVASGCQLGRNTQFGISYGEYDPISTPCNAFREVKQTDSDRALRGAFQHHTTDYRI